MFHPLHVVRTHTIRVPCPAPEAFELFTPLGEKRWAPGWNPVFLHPETGVPEVGAVFTTRAPDESVTTSWCIVAYDASAHRVRYVRLTPESRLALVDIVVTPASATTSTVHVSYTLTALTEHGNEYLARFTDEHFRAFIDHWATLIGACLHGKASPPAAPESPRTGGDGAA